MLRKNLEALRRTGKSLMPEGLERDMTGDDLADVIAYVAGTLPAQPVAADNACHGRSAGRRRNANARGLAARIEGPTIRLEETHNNLGYWENDDDVATWSIELAAAGSFTVDLEYACDDATAGNTFRLSIDGHELTRQVAGTGSVGRLPLLRIGRYHLARRYSHADVSLGGAASHRLST